MPTALAVTADWENHTLTLLDFDALVTASPDPASATDGGVPSLKTVPGKVGTVDLSKEAQAPYTVKITPDGATAIVAMSAGFFSIAGAGTLLLNASTVPTGPGEVLFVDLASRTVTASLDTGDGATGIAITHDGKTAFIAHAGATTITVVDVPGHKKIKDVDVGGTFAESVALDDTDTVGIVTALDPSTSQKNVRTFAVSDMASTLSMPIPLGTDAAGVPFFPGTKTAFVVLAYNPLTSPNAGYALIDASQPSSPRLIVETKWTDATYISYDAIPYPTNGTVLFPLAVNGAVEVREYALGASDVTLKKTYPVAPVTRLFGAFGSVVDAQGHMVLTLPGERELAVLDLPSGASFTVPWYAQASPLGIALH